jgi:hypothetical protein
LNIQSKPKPENNRLRELYGDKKVSYNNTYDFANLHYDKNVVEKNMPNYSQMQAQLTSQNPLIKPSVLV